MSALCQKQTLGKARLMSALPSKADIDQEACDVRFVQKRTLSELFDHLVGELLELPRHFQQAHRAVLDRAGLPCRAPAHRTGRPYCRPPLVRKAFSPRAIFSGEPCPTLR